MSRYDGATPIKLYRDDPSQRPVFALIDEDDLDRVSRSVWRLTRDGYVRATSKKHLASHHRMLHAYILRVEPGQIADHINGDKLDNRKANLRIVSAAQNAQNAKRPTFEGKTSKFKGVSRQGEFWRATIEANGVVHRLGTFDREEDAARAYDAAAIRFHGEFARTNATMKLYDRDVPFIPTCKNGGGSSYTKRNKRKRSQHDPRLLPKTYEERMDDRLRDQFGL